MAAPAKTLELRTSPHVLSGYAVDSIMFNVVVALAPAVVFAVYAFGWAAAAVLGDGDGDLRADRGDRRARDASTFDRRRLVGGGHRPALRADAAAGPAAVDGGRRRLRLDGRRQGPVRRAGTESVQPGAGRPRGDAGGVSGGDDHLAAAVRRRPLRLACRARSSTLPFAQPVYDAATQATPLALFKFGHHPTAAADLRSVSSAARRARPARCCCSLGGVYLVARNMMSWRTPVAIFASVAVLYRRAAPPRPGRAMPARSSCCWRAAWCSARCSWPPTW